MMDMAVHCIDLMEYITGMRVTKVGSFNENVAFREHSEYDVEDTSTVMLRMENGAQFVVQTNFNIPDEGGQMASGVFRHQGAPSGRYCDWPE